MRVLPLLLLLIELNCLNANPISNNVNEFYNTLEKRCPSIKNATTFAQQGVFKSCTDWKVIEQTKSLTKETEQNIRCLLYFDSFVSFCEELSKQNVSTIRLGLLIPELKDYTVNKICKGLTLFPVGRKFDHDILKTVINEEHCVKLCDSYTETPVMECSLAHYFANLNVTQLKTESLIKGIQQEKKETAGKAANTSSSSIAELLQNVTSFVKSKMEPSLLGTNTKGSQVNAKTSEGGVKQTSGGSEPAGAVNTPETGKPAKVSSPAEAGNTVQASQSTQGGKPELDGKPVQASQPVVENKPSKANEDHQESHSNRDSALKEQGQNDPKESPAKGSENSGKAEIQQVSPSKVNKESPPEKLESQAVIPPKDVAEEPVNSGKHGEEGNKEENLSQGNNEGLKEDTDYEGVDPEDEPLRPPEGDLGDSETPVKNEPTKPEDKNEAVKTQDKGKEPEPPAKFESPDTDNKDEMPETQQDAVPLEDVNKDKLDVVNTIPVNDSTFDDVDGESYFFSYFMVICVLFVLGYVGYHNRQKVIALVLEGKQGKRRYRGRRPNSANYHKLDSNLEEAISSSYTKSSSHIIY